MKKILMTLPWSSLAPDGADSARIVSGMTNSSAPLYAAHTLGAVGAGDPVVVVYVRAAQAFSLHAAGTGGEVEVTYFDPSGGEQARSTAFPVLSKVLKGGGGVPIEVPAQPWAGDGVVVLRVVTTTTVPMKSDAQACRGQQQRPLKSDDDDGAGAGADDLWPLPESVQCTAGGLPLVAGFKVRTSSPSAVAIAAAQRYTEFFAPAPLFLDVPTHGTGAGTRTLSGVALVVKNASEALGVETQYGFSLALTSTGSELTATVSSPYAAVSALETIGQLLSGCTAGFGCSTFNCTELALSDAPMFRHRGLMIDAGRRHYPLPLVKDLLEGMAMSRLNVLHLHFADYGNSEFEQFGAGGIRIESKRHPQLTAGLEDTAGTRLYYTQEEVRTIVAFAKLRGIRVVPELEQTGHASYLWPLAGPPHRLEFCSENTEDKTGAQVYNDPAGRAKTVLTSLVEEYSGLFPDAVFHVGSDETAYVGNCTKVNTIDLEREVVAKVVSLGKKPMLWWAPATSLQVAKPGETVVNAWTHSHGAGTLPGYSAVQATAAGYEAVESAGGQFYLDHPKGKGWADLSSYWFDITRGQTLTAKQQELLLGGEVSMWNNPWCLWGECHSTKGERFCGWWMSGMDPQYDAEYALSVQGAVWPKAAVAAGAFYRYNSSLPVAELTRRVGAFTAAMVRRGLRPCACSVFDGAGEGCTPAARCGVPYANRNASGAPVETCKSDDTDGLQFAALGLGAAGTSTIRVRVAPGPGDTAAGRGAGAVGAVTDAASALHNFSLDGGGGGGGGAHNAGLLDHNASYALADTACFARASWDCGAWGTQGAVITEKILSLGGPSHLALARRWLLNTPALGDTGEAFSTEGQQYHAGADGKWEANAELILSAALFAKHAGQHQIFAAPVSRLAGYDWLASSTIVPALMKLLSPKQSAARAAAPRPRPGQLPAKTDDVAIGAMAPMRWEGREVPLVRTPYGALPAACVREHGDDLLWLEEGVAVYANGSRQGAEPAAVAFCSDHGLKEALGYERGNGWRRSQNSRVVHTGAERTAGPLPAATYYQGATAVYGEACNHSQLDTWTAVYSLPDRDPVHGTIDFWLGVEPVSTMYGEDGRCNGHVPGANLTVLQPVVSWFGNKWSAASWNCCPFGQAHVGNRFHLQRPFPDVAVSIRRHMQADTEVFTVHMDAGFGGGQSTLAMMANGRLFGWFMAVQENHQLNESAECTQLLQPGDHFVFKNSELKLVDSGHLIRPNFTIREPWHQSPFSGKCGGRVDVSNETGGGSAEAFSIEMWGPPSPSPPQPPPPLPPKCLAKIRALCSPKLGSSCLPCAHDHAKDLSDAGCSPGDLKAICSRGLHAKVNLTITPTRQTDQMLISVSRAENRTYEHVAVLGLSSGKADGTAAVASKCYDVSDRADDNYYVAGTRFGHYVGGAIEFQSALLQLRATGVVGTGTPEVSLSWARWTSAVGSDTDGGIRTHHPGNISRCDTWPACQVLGRDVERARLGAGERLAAGEFTILFNGPCP
jgi:hexosaminidase